jgi:hypothetical protein
MSENSTDAKTDLPFLDIRDFPSSGRCVHINELRLPLKNAYNKSRGNQQYIDELLALLQTVINAAGTNKQKRKRRKVE